VAWPVKHAQVDDQHDQRENVEENPEIEQAVSLAEPGIVEF
jgi:hypothetical protein